MRPRLQNSKMTGSDPKSQRKNFSSPDLKHQNNPNYILKVSILNSQPFKIDSRTVRVIRITMKEYTLTRLELGKSPKWMIMSKRERSKSVQLDVPKVKTGYSGITYSQFSSELVWQWISVTNELWRPYHAYFTDK